MELSLVEVCRVIFERECWTRWSDYRDTIKHRQRGIMRGSSPTVKEGSITGEPSPPSRSGYCPVLSKRNAEKEGDPFQLAVLHRKVQTCIQLRAVPYVDVDIHCQRNCLCRCVVRREGPLN